MIRQSYFLVEGEILLTVKRRKNSLMLRKTTSYKKFSSTERIHLYPPCSPRHCIGTKAPEKMPAQQGNDLKVEQKIGLSCINNEQQLQLLVGGTFFAEAIYRDGKRPAIFCSFCLKNFLGVGNYYRSHTLGLLV